MLNMMCPKPACTNIFVTMVHGCCERRAGVKPKKEKISGLSKQAMKVSIFRAIKNKTALKLDRLAVLII